MWSNVYVTTGRTTGMATDTAADGSTMLSPEEAFTVLGNEVRLEVLRTLGEADEPLAYSELFERMEYDDPGNFSYHLDKLVDHFVAKTDAGYVLRRPGERVMEAILSGAVTTDPIRELTRTEKSCPFCSASIEVGYEHERVTMHCPECSGLLGREESEDGRFSEQGNLGIRPLPPAGVRGRTPEELHQVSEIWAATTMQAISRGVCPRCSGTIEHAVQVCESHDASDGLCDRCGLRLAATASAVCIGCIFEMEAPVAGHLSVHPQVMAFMIDHGIDPVAPEGYLPFAAVEEEVRSRQPFEARYTFTADDETLTLTVEGDLAVVEVI
jgi:DNA-binding transcriptional ArsR family regulator